MPKTKAATKGGSKREKPPALDQYTKPLFGIALAVLAYHVFRGMIAKEIQRIDMTETVSELELRQVFFGEGDNPQNYAVLCYPENAVFPISSVFQDAANEGSAPAQFRLLDCDAPIPGNKEGQSVVKRFGLNKKTRPVVFVSGAIGEPKQVPSKYLKTGGMLTKALKNLLEPKAEKIETTQDLRNKCLDKDHCALLLKGSKTSPKYIKEAIQKLVVEHPKVTFAAVDSSVLYVKGLEAEFLPELQPGVPRFVVFQKTDGGTKKDDSRLKTSAIALEKKDPTYLAMSDLLVSVLQGSASMTKVSTIPTIKTRTKKLEKSEHEKRQRRLNKTTASSSESSSSSSTFSHSGENDGSREGRRAERERRRAEHRKQNPNYREKTPEELQELERQRRIRMEEEAKKWNMAPEDEEDQETPDYMMDGDYDDEENLDEDEEEEDDEDVMDLD